MKTYRVAYSKLAPEDDTRTFHWRGLNSVAVNSWLRKHWRVIPLFLVTPALSPLLINDADQGRCAFLLLLVACFWVLELLPISLTALLPFLLGPLLGIGKSEQLARAYITDIHFMIVGGVVLSVAMEDTRLSRRFALHVVALLGTRPRWLMLGFMLPSWLLSMWMSNPGTTILMFPFVMATINETENAAKQMDRDGESIALDARKDADVKDGTAAAEEDNSGTAELNGFAENEQHACGREKNNQAACYCLSVAYACSVGGVATLIGTGTNLVLVGQLQQIYRVSNAITFSNWMAFSLPLSCLSLLLIWLILQLLFFGPRETVSCGPASSDQTRHEAHVRRYFVQQLEALGPVSFAEWATMASFPCVLLLLVTGKLTSTIGWHYLFEKPGRNSSVSDATAMILVALILLIIPNPAKKDPGATENGVVVSINNLGFRPVVCWQRVLQKIPLDVLLMIGGGMALAKLTKDTKLTDLIASNLTGALKSLPTMLTLLVLCFCVIWLTEVTSNTVTATVLLPIVAEIATCLNQNPLLFMVPVTVTCSYAFCIPTATPPNAIVFSSGRVTMTQMMKSGFMLNITFAVIVPFYTQLVGNWIFNVHEMPPWAEASHCANTTVSMG